MRGHPGKSGSKHPCWKGGTLVDRDGYIKTWAPKHPWPRKGYMMEHVRIMELSIERKICLNECVHHKDHDKTNNCLSNLQLMKRSEHSKLHRSKDAHLFVRDEKGRYKCGST